MVSKAAVMTSPIGIRSSRIGGTRAFTLVELAIVVAILASMTALVAPYFVSSFRRSQFEGSVREFVTTTRFARVQAAMHQQPVQIRVDLDNQMFWVVAHFSNVTGFDVEPSPEEGSVLRVSHMPRVARINAVLKPDEPETLAGIADITFYPNGTCESATVVFRGPEKRDVLVVSIEPVTAHASVAEPKL
jgi:prepilin-type N-terminal cleavage/methylation domain-containing protein